MDPTAEGGFTLDKLSRPKKIKPLIQIEKPKPVPIPGYMKAKVQC